MAGNTEFFVKMNRLAAPEAQPSPQPGFPVRFRPVVFDPSHDERRQGRVVEVETDESDAEVDTSRESGKHFFKDPIRGPLTERSREDQEKEIEESFKLGRNMRASNGKTRNKDVTALMSAKRALLHQQSAQVAAVQQEETSRHAAALLVNNLLMQGFHISAPGDSSGLPDSSLPQKPETEVKEPEQVTKDRQKLISAFHKELVRVSAPEAT